MLISTLLFVAFTQDAPLKEWIRKLASEKPEVREAATNALREAGRSAVRPLQEALQSEDAEVRSRARELLEERGRKQEVEKSLKKLADDLRGRLRKGTVHVDYDDIELGNIAQSFSTMESARIFVSPALRDRRVTLKARGVTTERLFELLAESVGGELRVAFGSLFVVRKGEKLPGPGVEELTSADQSNAALRQVELLFEDNRAIILKGAPLRELVERVGNFTGARLKVAPALEERRLSGQIGTGPVGSLLMLACLENDLAWSITEQGDLLLKAAPKERDW